jgi:hypothetical protein
MVDQSGARPRHAVDRDDPALVAGALHLVAQRELHFRGPGSIAASAGVPPLWRTCGEAADGLGERQLRNRDEPALFESPLLKPRPM